MFALRDAEYAELAKLKGCNGAVQPTPGQAFVRIDWQCGEDAVEPGLSLSVSMAFESDGSLGWFGMPVGTQYMALESMAALCARRI